MSNKTSENRKGFTLIEILVVIGIIAVLATIVIIAINPARQFAQARDTQRLSNLNAILNAVGQNIADNKGTFTCDDGVIPTSLTEMSKAAYDINDCISPTYMPAMVCDPDPALGVNCGTEATYETGYFIQRDATSGRITVSSTVELANSTDQVTR